MNHARSRTMLLIVAVCLFAAQVIRADAVTDWNVKACDIVAKSGLPAPPASRAMAIVHTAIYTAVNAITKRYPDEGSQIAAPEGASAEAAVAAASRTALVKLLPLQQEEIESVYQTALIRIANGQSKTDGIAVGEGAAGFILGFIADDGAAMAETYRPFTTVGIYVPTVIPAVPQWPQRRPWLMTKPSQFRPGPPPKLDSELWARDYNEVKTLGGKDSTRRTTSQTEIARFWEATNPAIYHGVVRSVANVPGREITQNARLFAGVTQAADDAVIAVFDAKYYYNFWRPVTAIRNGDIDGNDATERDAAWKPFIETPMHPEYPCAHCIVSGAIATVLRADIGDGPMPTMTTTSPTAPGITRSWTTTADFMQEVANGRIYDGVHYRNSTEVGTDMGKKIGALAVDKYLRRAR